MIYKGLHLNSDADQKSKIWTRKAMHFPNRYMQFRLGIFTLVQVSMEARIGHWIPWG